MSLAPKTHPVGAASESAEVHVTGIAPSTTGKQLEDFFSFCGVIRSLELQPDGDHQKATIHFAKASAASTAAMLNGSSLDGATLNVHLPGAASAQGSAATQGAEEDDKPVGQEDKPRTAIVAEYLAHGYEIGDHITKRAIELDQKHGVSNRFKNYLTSLDRSLGEQLAKTQAAPSATTSSTEHSPSGAAALESATEKETAKQPVPGASGGQEGPKTTTQVPGDAEQESGLGRKPTLSGVVQERVGQVLERPEVKSRTTFAWAKLNEYYNAIANHPRIRDFYSTAHKTVSDVHEEAKRIAEEKKKAGTATTSGPPTGEAPKKMSASLLLLALLVFSSVPSLPVRGHEHGEEPAPASVAGEKPHQVGMESYVQKHMASEHHIGAFDLGSFFQLHDLNRDGVLDRSEIEAIYGVHHSTSVKHSPTYEVHDEKAEHIVREVLRRLDHDGDGLITKSEFISAGADGLPSFEEYGKGVLGHHYDEESEYFVHHEEIYHNTPETQTDEAYNHPEDVEHFAHHEAIEREEEQRERHAEGMPTIEEDARRAAEAKAKGEKYESPYDAQMAAGVEKAAEEALKQTPEQHVFKTPEGNHVVNEVGSDAAGNTPGSSARVGESEDARRERLTRAKFEASKRPAYGEGGSGFARPKDDADRMRKGAPYKYPPIAPTKARLKKGSYFGEF